MRTVSIGELEVFPQGLGCMGMSHSYGSADWDTSISTIRTAIDLGVTLFDTADIYGAGHNEVLLGRAISDGRDRVQIATKFGVVRVGTHREVRGDSEYVRHACESSLRRLGVESIDLFYLHRPPQNVDIETAVGAMAELVAEGKVRHLGLSDVSVDELWRASRVHTISAVQVEYSLWNRTAEEGLTGTLRELGVCLVPYAPLGRGFLAGSFDADSLEGGDFRLTHSRFTRDAQRTNTAILDDIRGVARRLGGSPSQVALAWLHTQGRRLGVSLVPIPGTKHRQRLEENLAALDFDLTTEDLELLDSIAARSA